MLYFINPFFIPLHFVITVYPSPAKYIYALHSSQTRFYGHLHPKDCTIYNYKQIIYSSMDHDRVAFDISKEINLGSTRLNCYHDY